MLEDRPRPAELPALPEPAAGAIADLSGRERDLICALSYVHLTCGETARSVAMLRLIEAEHPDDRGFLRILAYALIADGQSEAALDVLARLEGMEDEPAARIFLALMRSHALHGSGRLEDAQDAFRHYVSLRAANAARSGMPR
ncbi:tetratricopeptide repeat protein [Terrihabitans sp. B22-R8]|uniref:type III secretion apparatus assembly chaperone SctY n=1 Tax=Terrihabitans sp. B22-R8 TaxID=3425128 RepID=UPI00403CA9C2